MESFEGEVAPDCWNMTPPSAPDEDSLETEVGPGWSEKGDWSVSTRTSSNRDRGQLQVTILALRKVPLHCEYRLVDALKSLLAPLFDALLTGSKPIDFNGDRDNVVVLSGNPLSHDRELKWRGENGAGRRQLDLEKKSLIERVGAEQADRVWKKLPRQRNAGRPSLNSSTVSSAGGNRGNDVRDEEIANLKKQNKKLASDLENARTHIFSLQSCRKKFTPEDAGRDYDIPVGSVSDWVQKHVAPVADDDDKRKNFDGIARRKPSDISLLRGYLLRHGDLVHGIMFPDTDVDVVIAIVMRFLQDNIFERGCINEPAGQVISAIEVAMQNCVEPKRDQFAIRTWRAEAFTAVLSTPDYATMRKQRLEELTTVLCNGMKLFCQVVGRNLDTVYSSCMEVVVKPALELNEKFLTSTHHFYLNLRTYINRDHNGNLKMSNDFAKDLDKIKCENVLKNRRIIHVEKLDEQLVKDCIEGSFINILTVAPGLHMRQVGRRDTIEPPAVIRKQHVLVAYDGQKGRDHYLSGWQQHSLMGWVYSRPRTFAQFVRGGRPIILREPEAIPTPVRKASMPAQNIWELSGPASCIPEQKSWTSGNSARTNNEPNYWDNCGQCQEAWALGGSDHYPPNPLHPFSRQSFPTFDDGARDDEPMTMWEY